MSSKANMAKNASINFSNRFAENYPYFNDLMRGAITESMYWNIYSESQFRQNTLPVSYIKELFALNMQRTVPGTLDLYRKLVLPNRQRPSYFIVSDHIKEYSDLVKKWHPDIFEWADGVFWSYDYGGIKQDEDFFIGFLQKNNFNKNNVIFIDDSIRNIKNAEKAGILSFHFSDSKDLKGKLAKYGFFFN